MKNPIIPPPTKEVDQHEIIKSLSKMSAMVHMYDAMCFSSDARHALEQALSEFAMRNGGPNSFFVSSNGLKDYITDMEYLGHPLPVLTQVNKEQRAQTNPTWSHGDDVLPMPAGYTLSQIICHREPNHNQPLFVSVEHRNKVVRRAFVD